MSKVYLHSEDLTVTYEDTPEIREKVFNKVIEYYVQNQAFAGEVISQSDDCIIDAPGVLCDIADNILKFDAKWNDDE